MRSAVVLALSLLFATPGLADLNLGVSAYERGDFAAAFKEFLALAREGDVGAQYNLGVMYEYGEGVPKSIGEALNWYQAAAEQGHAASQMVLVFMLEDPRAAYHWVQVALANSLSADERRAATHRRAFLVEALKLAPAQSMPRPTNQGPIVRNYSGNRGSTNKWAAVFGSRYDFVLNPAGKVPVVEYFDYRCGPCKRAYKNVQRLQSVAARYSIRFIFKEFPILGSKSEYAAKAAIAARRQGKYLVFHNALMSHRGGLTKDTVLTKAAAVGLNVDRLVVDMKSPDVEVELEANRASARAMDISATPSFVIGVTVVRGGPSYKRMLALVEKFKKTIE